MVLNVWFRPFSLCTVTEGLLGGVSSVAMQLDSSFELPKVPSMSFATLLLGAMVSRKTCRAQSIEPQYLRHGKVEVLHRVILI
jgi:hypothetical protein